jgi:hypothetical protein
MKIKKKEAVYRWSVSKRTQFHVNHRLVFGKEHNVSVVGSDSVINEKCETYSFHQIHLHHYHRSTDTNFGQLLNLFLKAVLSI